MKKTNEVAVVQRGSGHPARFNPEDHGYVRPSTDIYETSDAYVVILDMPGSAKNSISLTVDGDALVVTSPLKEIIGLSGKGYYRAFNLGDGIDRESIDARFENGTLSLKLFKKEVVKPREITIR